MFDVYKRSKITATYFILSTSVQRNDDAMKNKGPEKQK
jgi:peptidoglycan/xylan/chitin deacetylase (PgdA/CDA1 family)